MKKAIGIDLGTTYSCVGIWEQGKPIIIPNDSGERTTPSMVTFIGNQILIGEGSRNVFYHNIKNTVYDAKRLIGRKYKDKEVQEDKRNLLYDIEEDKETEGIKIKVENNNKIEYYYPEEIAQIILSKMRQMSEMHTNDKIEDAVITVPAYFNEKQRQCTKDAAKAAGLNVLRIINEPTAAAIAFGLQKNNTLKDKNVLIFDLGGGTFDVSVLNITNEGIVIIKAISGDTHLGGEDFDNQLVQYCINEFKNTNELDENTNINEKGRIRLKISCERAKKLLSSMEETIIDIEKFYDQKDLNITITRSDFNNICDCLFKKCLSCVKLALENAKLKKEEIDDIVLVGGSSRIPKIKEMMIEYFNRKDENDLVRNISIHPDEAVAIGATYLAYIIKGNIQFDSTILLDIVGMSIGIEIYGEKLDIIIPKGTNIPFSCTKIFTTCYDNQTSINFKVYQGENINNASDNHFLKEFIIDNIEKAKSGEMQFEVTFEIDINSCLNVTAINLNNKKSIKVNFNDVYYKKNELKIQKMLKREEERKKNEEMFQDSIKLKNELLGLCFKERDKGNEIAIGIINLIKKDKEIFNKKKFDDYIKILNYYKQIENDKKKNSEKYKKELLQLCSDEIDNNEKVNQIIEEINCDNIIIDEDIYQKYLKMIFDN